MSIFDNLLDSSKDFTEETFVSDDEAKRRFVICSECDKFWPITNQCSLCGCFMKIKTKLKKFNGEIVKCPDNPPSW